MKNVILTLGVVLLCLSTSMAQWNGNNTTTGRAGIGQGYSNAYKLNVYNNDSSTGIRLYNSYGGNGFSGTYGIYSYMTSSETSGTRYGIYSQTASSQDYAIYGRGRVGVHGELWHINTSINNRWLTYLGWNGSNYSQNFMPVDADGGYLFDRRLKLTREGQMIKFVDKKSMAAFSVRYDNKNNFQVLGDGTTYAREVIVTLSDFPFPDYVFEDNYELMTLSDLKTYIQKENHLPNIPSAKEVETSGLSVGELTIKQMEKIEELTLYIIDLNERLETLEKENAALKKG